MDKFFFCNLLYVTNFLIFSMIYKRFLNPNCLISYIIFAYQYHFCFNLTYIIINLKKCFMIDQKIGVSALFLSFHLYDFFPFRRSLVSKVVRRCFGLSVLHFCHTRSINAHYFLSGHCYVVTILYWCGSCQTKRTGHFHVQP